MNTQNSSPEIGEKISTNIAAQSTDSTPEPEIIIEKGSPLLYKSVVFDVDYDVAKAKGYTHIFPIVLFMQPTTSTKISVSKSMLICMRSC